VDDDKLYFRSDKIGAIGFDLWQVKSGTIFDNVLITDDADYAKKVGDDTWGVTKDAEKSMKEKQDEEEKKAREEEEAARKESEQGEEEEGDDEQEEDDDEEEDEEAADHDEL